MSIRECLIHDGPNCGSAPTALGTAAQTSVDLCWAARAALAWVEARAHISVRKGVAGAHDHGRESGRQARERIMAPSMTRQKSSRPLSKGCWLMADFLLRFAAVSPFRALCRDRNERPRFSEEAEKQRSAEQQSKG